MLLNGVETMGKRRVRLWLLRKIGQKYVMRIKRRLGYLGWKIRANQIATEFACDIIEDIWDVIEK